MSYIRTFFISTITLLVLFVGLIWAIDPYNKLGNNIFNFKTKAVAQSRENKYYQLESAKKDYTAFILGSSAAHRYPTQVANKLTGLLTYNYAVQHSTVYDYLAQVRHIIDKFRPKLIIMQLDFSGFDKNYKVDNRLFNSPLKKYLKQQKRPKVFFNNDLFTLDALRDSLRVVYVNLFGKARHIYLEDGNYVYEKNKKGIIKIKQDSNPNFVLDSERVELVKEIRSICEKNHIRLITLTSPISYNHLSKILSNSEFKKKHDHFIQSIKEVLPEFYNFQTEEIKDQSTPENFLDSTHLSQEMSAHILKNILK